MNLVIIYLLLSILLLIFSATFLVRSVKRIATLFGISEFSASFILVALATSFPELLVGINSAISGNPSLSFGNVLGANLLNLTLVLGVILIIAGKSKVESKEVRDNTILIYLMILLPLILYVIGMTLSRLDGIILVLGFIFLVRKITVRPQKSFLLNPSIPKTLFSFFISFTVLYLSARLVVQYSTDLAIQLGLSDLIIGLFIISIGTTLPEFAFGVQAALKKHNTMALGDQIGSVIANSTLILGIVAIIHPIVTDIRGFLIASIFIIIIMAFLLIRLLRNNLSRLDGIILILIYILFVVTQFA
ncbi:MAG: hypothetical protein KKF56_00455 [Nanoarchaeota archaeon]|nr:hypothetical protein [Nanoarchaeota archaeon]